MNNMKFIRYFPEGSHLIGVVIDVLCRRQSQFVRKKIWTYDTQLKLLTPILHFCSKHLLGESHHQKIDIDILLIVINIRILDKRRPELRTEIIIPYIHSSEVFYHRTCVAVSLCHIVDDVRHWCTLFLFTSIVYEGRIVNQTTDVVFVALLVPTFIVGTIIFLVVAIVVLFRIFKKLKK